MLAEKLLTPVMRYLTAKNLDLEPVENYPLPEAKPGKEYLLYVHIPFCETLCPYCSFNRFVFRESIARTYFTALRKEMHMVAEKGYHFTSMYIGGGTPTVLMDELVQTIDLAKELFPIQEVSCETNPNHLVPEIIEPLKGRVQRLSVGMQSFDDDLLKQMNRYERFGSGELNVERIKLVSRDFPSLNVDMIFNFPNQTEEKLANDIKAILESGAYQVTFYPLMSSPSVEKSLHKTVGRVSYANEYPFYKQILEGLKHEYTPLSAWTFARRSDSMIDEYIVDYEEYVGIGSGSFSYLNGALLANTFSVSTYKQKIENNQSAITGISRFAAREQMRYRFLMSLFGLRLDKTAFYRDFGNKSLERSLWLEMAFMKAVGAYAANNGQEITLTEIGQYMLVVMMREFFANLNNIRDKQRKKLTPAEQADTVMDACAGVHQPHKSIS